MLYSQNPDYVFDLTYACNEATELYRNFMTVNKKPYDLINARINSEIKRYDGLIFSLKCLPPALIQMKGKRRLHTPDTLSLSAQADRAACIQSAMQLRDNIVKTQRLITADSIAFSHVSTILGKLNTYAQKRYDDIQSSIFRDNGSTYFEILGNFGHNIDRAKLDVTNKYNLGNESRFAKSQWRGSVIVGFVIFVVFYLVLSFVLGFLLTKLLYYVLKRLKWVNFGTNEVRAMRLRKWKKSSPL